MHAFRAVETAAYCPRKLYYRRRQPPDERDDAPDRVEQRRELAFAYDRLLDDETPLRAAPIEVTPTQFRTRLGCARARLDNWETIVDPPERDVFLSGRECHGVAHKLLGGTPPSLSLVFAGNPPEEGVWKPQSVRLMAAAKALSWERETRVERVVAEYPAYGIVREVPVDARRTAAYREAVRTADAIDGPPARTTNRSKCSPCDYRDQCGVKTRSLRSLLGG
jgi:CRISPR-associated exonuclease Cas4